MEIKQYARDIVEQVRPYWGALSTIGAIAFATGVATEGLDYLLVRETTHIGGILVALGLLCINTELNMNRFIGSGEQYAQVSM